MARLDSALVRRAKELLHPGGFTAGAPPIEMLALAKQLKDERAFGYARRILARSLAMPGLDPVLQLALAQQHALCTYKDPELPVAMRLEHALDILDRADNLHETRNPETLGLAGAIHKRKWELDAQKQHLERALFYYRRGYEQGAAVDYGYTGINTAYVLDLLASQEAEQAAEAGVVSESAVERSTEAQRIRADLIATLPLVGRQSDEAWLEQEWWFLTTIAEAYFGLERYEEALPWLRQAAAVTHVASWEHETTARQLASLARLHHPELQTLDAFENSPAGNVLREFLGNNTAAVLTSFIGKVGVALSGGGFRASLFHIGVLSKLAELDLLRHVEVLSCVSGGSIIGAHYYLEVRKLLQTKPDHEITRADYVAMMQRIGRDFLEGVQHNIRMQLAAEVGTNLKMMLVPNYSRTQRLGELYESLIYAKVQDGEGDAPRWLNDLLIKPAGEPEDFAPQYDNWRRYAKVPMLIINATTLNTGHNWQFTASWMGESPASINTEIDGNYHLRRLPYTEAPPRYQRFRLGHAVAASSCVPGLFEPLVIEGLYSDKVVRLVDGGLHDNQGNVGLLEQDCTMILVSDASGQMESLDSPKESFVGVQRRGSNILMARVRDAQHRDLVARHRASVLRGLLYVHLKKDLDVVPINWIGCDDPQDEVYAERVNKPPSPMTVYGVPKAIQQRLAAIRTDLDSFTDAEAYALMTSGYRMMAYECATWLRDFATPPTTPSDWPFLAIEQVWGTTAGENVLQVLDAARSRTFKIWRISRPLRVTARALGITGLLGLGRATWAWRSRPVVTVGQLGSAAGAAATGLLVGPLLRRLVPYRKPSGQIGLGMLMSGPGWIIAKIHLRIFDRMYLRRGRLDVTDPDDMRPS